MQYFPMAVSIVAVMAVNWPLIWVGFDQHHEGLITAARQAIRNGENPFTLFSQYGPLFNLLPVATAALGLESFAILRFIIALCYAVLPGLVWAMARPFHVEWIVIPWTAVMIWLFPFGPEVTLLVWPSVFTLLLTMTAMTALSFWLAGLSRAWGRCAGIVAALAIWIKVNVGLLLVIAIFLFSLCAWIMDRRERHLLAPIQGIAATLAVMALILLLSGSFSLYWLHQFSLARFMAPYIPEVWHDRPASLHFIWESLFPRLFTPLGAETVLPYWTWIVLLNLVLCIAMVICNFFVQPTPQSLFAALLPSIGIASWGQFYPVSDELHHFWAGLPILAAVIVVPAVLLVQCEVFQRIKWLRWSHSFVLLIGTSLLLVQASQRVTVTATELRQLEVGNPTLNTLTFRASEADHLDAYLAAFSAEDPFGTGLLMINLTPDAWAAAPRLLDKSALMLPAFHTLYQDARPQSAREIFELLKHPTTEDRPKRALTMGTLFYVPNWPASRLLPDGRVLLRPASGAAAPSAFTYGEECRSILMGVQLVNPAYMRDQRRFWGALQPQVPLSARVEFNALVSRRNVEGSRATIFSNVGVGHRTGYRGFALQKLPEQGESFYLVEFTQRGEPVPLLKFDLRPEQADHITLLFWDGIWTGFLNGVTVGQASSLHSTLDGADTLRFNTGRTFSTYFVGEILDFRIDDLTSCVSVPAPLVLNQGVSGRLFDLADR